MQFKNRSEIHFTDIDEEIFNCEEFNIKIGDLGFAREARGMLDSYCGTPINMAPEVLEKRVYSTKADVWSLGIVVYELLTGTPPFIANTKSELKSNIR